MQYKRMFILLIFIKCAGLHFIIKVRVSINAEI